MSLYTCILLYHTSQGHHHALLRPYRRSSHAIAWLSDVPSNPTPLSLSIASVATILVSRYALDPETLIVLDYTPPSGDDGTKGEVSRVFLTWHDERFRDPRWQVLTPHDIAELIGERVSLDAPVWQARPTTGLYGCTVGQRQALVHPADIEEWQAIVGEEGEAQIEFSFGNKH